MKTNKKEFAKKTLELLRCGFALRFESGKCAKLDNFGEYIKIVGAGAWAEKNTQKDWYEELRDVIGFSEYEILPVDYWEWGL